MTNINDALDLIPPPIAIPFNGDKTQFLNGANQFSTPSGGTSGSSWIPLVDGSEPPNFITDGAGVLILVTYP